MIRVEDLHMHFGGIRAVDGASIDDRRRLDHRPDRPERRRQVDALQRHRRPLPADLRPGLARRRGDHRPAAARALPQGAPAHLPDRPRVLDPDGAREPDDGARRPARRGALGQPGSSPAASAPARPRCAPRPTRSSRFLEIGHVADELAGNLSGGQKKLLELGRTMMVDAKIVFLDEVGAGVNRTLLEHHRRRDPQAQPRARLHLLHGRARHGLHRPALRDPVIVMAEGKVLTVGPPSEVMKNEAVIEAYLGRGLKNKPARRERRAASELPHRRGDDRRLRAAPTSCTAAPSPSTRARSR